jgi:hypothetical protein
MPHVLETPESVEHELSEKAPREVLQAPEALTQTSSQPRHSFFASLRSLVRSSTSSRRWERPSHTVCAPVELRAIDRLAQEQPHLFLLIIHG